MGNAPSTHSENRRQAEETAPTRAASQPPQAIHSLLIACSCYIAQVEAVKTATQNAILDAATRKVSQMLQYRSGAMTHIKARYAAEYHHEASFNADAVKKGSALRCDVVDGEKAADLRIINSSKPGATLQEVQVKTGSRGYVCKSLEHPKYEGMQKIVPRGLENPEKGFDSRVKLGGASSSPLSNNDAYNMVRDPKKHFDSMRPSVAQVALKSGLAHAAFSGAAAAAFTTATTLRSKGTIENEDVGLIAEAAAIGAVSSGVGAAVTMALGDGVGGGIASSTLVTAYHMLKCDDVKCRAKELAQGAAGTTAGLTTLATMCPALAAFGPPGVILCPAAMLAASFAARKSAKAVVDAVAS